MNSYFLVTQEIAPAVAMIKSGRVVAFPTGTCYGLAVDALQGHALQRLRNMKQREQEKTFTVFVKSSLWNIYFNLGEEEKNFLKTYANQAVTLLVEPKAPLQHLVVDGRVGLRIIDHPLMKALADAVDVPLTATSANISGQASCQDVTCITNYFSGKLSDDLLKIHEPDQPRGAHDTTYDLSLGCILDGGSLPASLPSTMVKIEDGKIVVVRPGRVEVIAS